MAFLLFGTISAAIILLLYGCFQPRQHKGIRLRVIDPEEERKKKRKKIRGLIFGVFPFTKKFIAKMGLEAKLKDKLDAGRVKLAPAEFFNLKLMMMFVMLMATFFVMGKLEPLIIIFALGLGYLLPDLWLKKRISRRRYMIARLLPETVDLLGLCVEAGLDFTTAVKWVIDKVPPNPMLEELSFVLEEIRWGKPRSQALKDMSRRLNVSEVSSFVQTMVQAERMGTPVAEAFAILSEDARLQRFHRGERIALQSPIKILIPLIFCILPVIAIVVGGPVLLQFMQGNMFEGLEGGLVAGR